MVRNLLRAAHPEAPVSEPRHPAVERELDEWTVPELARQLGLPQSTVYSWVHRGRLPSRSVSAGSRPNRLVRANTETIAALHAATKEANP